MASKQDWTELLLTCVLTGLHRQFFSLKLLLSRSVHEGCRRILAQCETFPQPLCFLGLVAWMNSSILRFHAVKGPLSEWTYSTKASDAKRWNRGTSPRLDCCLPFLLTLHQCCPPRLASVCLRVCLFRCDVSVVFSQTQAATLCSRADGIPLPHPPSYIKFAAGPL